jgi:hypothetical protein
MASTEVPQFKPSYKTSGCQGLRAEERNGLTILRFLFEQAIRSGRRRICAIESRKPLGKTSTGKQISLVRLSGRKDDRKWGAVGTARLDCRVPDNPPRCPSPFYFHIFSLVSPRSFQIRLLCHGTFRIFPKTMADVRLPLLFCVSNAIFSSHAHHTKSFRPFWQSMLTGFVLFCVPVSSLNFTRDYWLTRGSCPCADLIGNVRCHHCDWCRRASSISHFARRQGQFLTIRMLCYRRVLWRLHQ